MAYRINGALVGLALCASVLSAPAALGQGTGADSGDPNVTIDARDMQTLEDNALKAAAIYCLERKKGKSSDEAMLTAIDKTLIRELPRKIQARKLADYISANACDMDRTTTSAPNAGTCEMVINGWRPKTCAGGPNLRTWSGAGGR